MLSRISHLRGLAVALLMLGAPGGALAGVHQRGSAPVTIRIEPIAEISLPQGNQFALVVTPPVCLLPLFSWQSCWLPVWLPILPVRIPFSVKGNASAAVSATPAGFLRIYSGRYLGKAARSNGATLGYHVITHFPVLDPSYHWTGDWTGWSDWSLWNNWPGYGLLPIWSHVSQLPGLNGAGTPPLAANLVDRHGIAYGVVYAVAARNWTTTGASADSGNYYGTIEITVTAGQQ